MGPAFVLFTGIPASGKTTLSRAVAEVLRRREIPCFWIDGDELRKAYSAGLGFDREGRRENLRRAAEVGRVFYDKGEVVLAALVAPFREDRAELRSKFPRFLEVHLVCDALICARRDPKGLWWKASMGHLKGLTGFDAPYEVPEHPELRLDTGQEGLLDCRNKVIDLLSSAGNGPEAGVS